jgi:hypothetical protein
MPQFLCPNCAGHISFWDRSFAPYHCSKCKTDNKKASQADILETVRRLEDRVFAILLAPLPRVSRAAMQRRLSNPRVRGLTKVVGGFALTVPIILAFYAIGKLTHQWLTPISAVTALPLTISMVGWVEVFSGIGFADLANRFERGGILVKTAIIILVLSVLALYALLLMRITNLDAIRRYWW